ncbi:MAG: hypothetical protein ACI95T_001150 [Flavobacteriales bacterium]|jgi:hypothetical protein
MRYNLYIYIRHHNVVKVTYIHHVKPITTSDHFRFFLTIRPAISPDRLAKEININRSNLKKVIDGDRQIPRNRKSDFIRIMKKYGYSVLTECLNT